ncbi:centrosome-associated protein CEP250-like isoform X2 [Cuculus canorus]|uniref:centrosome-associated protein CEP250-like isoform X2 n=1 Tax=Cuculus canorus TaxID=55661 RepID=UPI0023AB099F|nr:centrosome-associated protein CEP250-like isoform X2 [Cuculus canorus]
MAAAWGESAERWQTLGSQEAMARTLEDKVLKYWTRSQVLEEPLQAVGEFFPDTEYEATDAPGLKKALLLFEEEWQRYEKLVEVNAFLREHLHKADEVNSALKEEVGNLTVAGMRAREELELKESDWRNEREVLKEELSAKQDSMNFLQQQHRQQEEKCRKLQRRVEELEVERKTSGIQQQHLQSVVEALRSDCVKLEKTREELQQQLEVMEQKASRLHQSNMELRLKEDLAKREQQEEMERARCHQELLLKDLGALEGKHSSLQSELVAAREELEELHLQRDLLQREKHELAVALEKAEQSVAKLTGAQNQLSAEVADLRAATADMGSINEALAWDKVQLNKLVLQLEEETEALSRRVDETERRKISEQEKLQLCERMNEELSAEKAHLEQLLKKAEEQEKGLQVELMALRREKEESQEELQVSQQQQELVRSGLEELRQECSRQADALAKMSREKELLVQEKADLEVRLRDTEWDRRGLSEQLAEARSGKETVESSLLEARQRLSQLEITRSQLEIQLHAVMQTKEVMQGELKFLQQELEAERSLTRQEREETSQQLLVTKQQYDSAFELQQSAHEVEIKKLLQDLASERKEVEEMQKKWESEKAEREEEAEKKLLDLKQKVAAMQAEQEEERARAENARQENVAEKLQRELQASRSKIEAVENRHKQEIKTIKGEMSILVQQRNALQNQVEELTSQLATSKASQQAICHKAQQDLNEAQELSRKKMLEAVHLQKILDEKRSRWEEVEHQNRELQVSLQSLERKRSQWEEVERHNVKLQTSLKILESENARLTQSLKEKEEKLRTLEENNVAQHKEVSRLLSAIEQGQQQSSDDRREIEALNNQAIAEGEQQSWLSEKRFFLRQLECLQRTVAKLVEEKMELKEFNAELRRTLKEVERERRKLKRYFKHQSLPDA